MPGAIAALTVAAALCLVLGIVAECQQRILMLRRDQYDVAAAAAVAAAGAAFRNVFFAAKGQTAVAAITGLHQNSCFVDEHRKAAGEKRRLECGRPQPARKLDYALALTLTNLPMRPRSWYSTTPVTLANSVSSLPQPTLSPGLIL